MAMPRGLERKLLNYFLLIVIAALMIGAEFVFEMSGSGLREELWQSMVPADSELAFESIDAAAFAPLLDFRRKIVGMLLVLVIVVAIVLLMFIRNVTTPLQRLVDAAGKINDGDLSQVIQVKADDEIGQLGTAINGLSSNLQEIAAFSRHASSDILEQLSSLRREQAASGDPSQPLDDGRQLRLAAAEESAQALFDFLDSIELLGTELRETEERG